MSVLVIGEEEKKAIARLIKHAEANVLSIAEVKATAAGQANPIGDNYDFRLELPKDFRVVFSFEQQPQGEMRHISISLDPRNHKPGCCPSPHAVNMLLEEFGFRHRAPLDDTEMIAPGLFIWLETVENGQSHAVNCLEFVDPVVEARLVNTVNECYQPRHIDETRLRDLH